MHPSLFYAIAGLTKVVQKSPESDWNPFYKYQETSNVCLAEFYGPRLTDELANE